LFVANKKVKIYERLKVNGKWADRTVPVPKLRSDETLDPKHDRPGHFYVTWYNGRNKRRHPEALKTLTEAVDLQVAKAFYLRNRKRAGGAATSRSSSCFSKPIHWHL
jgi:hypothetical protein